MPLRLGLRSLLCFPPHSCPWPRSPWFPLSLSCLLLPFFSFSYNLLRFLSVERPLRAFPPSLTSVYLAASKFLSLAFHKSHAHEFLLIIVIILDKSLLVNVQVPLKALEVYLEKKEQEEAPFPFPSCPLRLSPPDIPVLYK